MGTLGISLLFVGIVMVINGISSMKKFDLKSIAILNLFVGALLAFMNLSNFTKASTILDFQNVASGMLFAITYLFIALNFILKLDVRIFGWFSLFVAIYATVMAIICAGNGDVRFTLLWTAWAILWLEGFLELSLGWKLNKFFAFLSIGEGIFAAFLPAMVMLLDKW